MFALSLLNQTQPFYMLFCIHDVVHIHNGKKQHITVVQPLHFTGEGVEDPPRDTHQGAAELEQEPRPLPPSSGKATTCSHDPEKGESSTGNLQSSGNREGTFTLLCHGHSSLVRPVAPSENVLK